MNANLLNISSLCDDNDLEKSGIYTLICKPTNKMYIGQTRRGFLVRWLEHQGMLSKNRHSVYIQNAFNKYGINNFEFKIIEILPDNISEPCKWLNEHEMYWIKYYRDKFGERFLFNLNSGGDGNTAPIEEVRKMMSEERKRRWQNEEYKKKVSAACKGHRTEDPKLISIRSKELWQNEEYRNKNKGNKGHKLSDEKKKERSQITTQYFKDLNNRKKVSESVKRYFETNKDAHKMRSEAAKKAYENNPELSKKTSDIGKKLWSSIEHRLKMYKARGLNTEAVWIDNILSTVYEMQPNLRYKPLLFKIHLIQQICKFHS